jgi:hypothetical protein
MRLLPALLLAGCYTADRIVVIVGLDAKRPTAAVRQELDNVWPDAVGCEDATVAECVEGVRKALNDEQFTRARARVDGGSLDIAYEGELPHERLEEVGVLRIHETRRHGGRDRFAMLFTPKAGETVDVRGRYRRYDYPDGDDAKQLWVLAGRRHTVTMTWTAMEEGNVVTAPRWVTPEIEAALRGAGLLTE